MKQLVTMLSVALLFSACAEQKTMRLDRGPDMEMRASASQEALARMSQMSPEQMMKKIKEAGTPGQAHQMLQPLVGQWTTESRWWKEPGAKPEVTMGTARSDWILGKRFVEENYRGTFMGEPFEGIGTTGFDTVKGRYVSTWKDSMGTGIMIGEGSYNPATRILEITSRYSCPITETERQSRMTVKIMDDNTHVMEMFDTAPDGREFKNMEVVYKRAPLR